VRGRQDGRGKESERGQDGSRKWGEEGGWLRKFMDGRGGRREGGLGIRGSKKREREEN